MLCTCVDLCVGMCMCVQIPEEARSVGSPLELELQVVVFHPTGVLFLEDQDTLPTAVLPP